MAQPELPRQETALATPEFELDPNGVGFAVQAAVGKLVEAAEVNSREDREMRAHNKIAANHLRIAASHLRTDVGIMASTLDLIAKRHDQRPWEDVIEGYAAESAEASAIDGSAE